MRLYDGHSLSKHPQIWMADGYPMQPAAHNLSLIKEIKDGDACKIHISFRDITSVCHNHDYEF